MTPIQLPANPALKGYPASLPLEIALKTAPLKDICAAYEIDRDQFQQLLENPTFVADLAAANELVAKEGMSFKLKSRMQAEELLKTSWQMIHSADTPPSVKADLLKATVRWGGLEQDAKASSAQQGNTLAIQINLG